MLGVPGVSLCAESSWAALQTVPLWEPPHTYAARHRFSLRKQRFGGVGADGRRSVTKRVDGCSATLRAAGTHRQPSSETPAMHVGGKPAPALHRAALRLQHSSVAFPPAGNRERRARGCPCFLLPAARCSRGRVLRALLRAGRCRHGPSFVRPFRTSARGRSPLSRRSVHLRRGAARHGRPLCGDEAGQRGTSGSGTEVAV